MHELDCIWGGQSLVTPVIGSPHGNLDDPRKVSQCAGCTDRNESNCQAPRKTGNAQNQSPTTDRQPRCPPRAPAELPFSLFRDTLLTSHTPANTCLRRPQAPPRCNGPNMARGQRLDHGQMARGQPLAGAESRPRCGQTPQHAGKRCLDAASGTGRVGRSRPAATHPASPHRPANWPDGLISFGPWRPR